MEISFESVETEKLFGDDSKLINMFGGEMAKRIRRRLDDLLAASTLEEMKNLPGRITRCSDTEPEMWSVDLVYPQRLLLTLTEPVQRKINNDVNQSGVKKLTVCGVQ